jgi:transcriptional regulator of acetoin/glycerol metabolism
MSQLNILFLLDEPDAALAPLASTLRDAGHEVQVAASTEAATLLRGGSGFDAVLRVTTPATDAPAPLDDAEKHHIAATLRHTRGNKRQAAHLLGIARSTLLAKVRKYGLDGVRG